MIFFAAHSGASMNHRPAGILAQCNLALFQASFNTPALELGYNQFIYYISF